MENGSGAALIFPQTQPPGEDMRNALQIAEGWAEILKHDQHVQDEQKAFGDVVRLIRSALEKLAEPREAAIRRAATIIRIAGHLEPDEREARDAAQVLTIAALEWR
jgi:hypothetical protein